MDGIMQELEEQERVIAGVDLNGHVGSENEAIGRVHGANGIGERNPEGESVVDFAVSFDMAIGQSRWDREPDSWIEGSGRLEVRIRFEIRGNWRNSYRDTGGIRFYREREVQLVRENEKLKSENKEMRKELRELKGVVEKVEENVELKMRENEERMEE
ncbi:uncharacterized protein LOC135200723 [Macrobrachium nipponense]|uniref:uncharacterized protein LOC135200723 n=1 Tax=Macrobrachium nipponense TaxID=159736 RepID=UPI0030C7EDD1